MTNATLELADAVVTEPVSLFEPRESSVVMPMLNSFDVENVSIGLDITLAQWNTMKLLLDGKILATHLSREMYEEVSRLGFTSDVVHFAVERNKDLSVKRKEQIESFFEWYGPDILLLTKEKYRSSKNILDNSTVQVGCLLRI